MFARTVKVSLIALGLAAVVAGVSVAGPQPGPHFSAGILAGYNAGTGIQFNGRLSDFAAGFPLGVKLGVGYATGEPGKATDARRIFINNATNGVPEESAHSWDFRLDFEYPVKLFHLKRAYLVGGPRYTRFLANFKFVGGNEDFDVKTNTWGVGVGLETMFAISSRVDLVFNGGYDYFPKATLTGHDTSYSPDGDDVNPREDYTYSDADKAINQPKHEFRLLAGFSYNFGL